MYGAKPRSLAPLAFPGGAVPPFKQTSLRAA